MEKKYIRDDHEIFMRNYQNLEALGIPQKTSRKVKDAYEDINTIFSGTVCNLSSRQIERYKKGECEPRVVRWGKIYSNLSKNHRFTNCPPELKQQILTTAGVFRNKDPLFSLDNCRECKMCAYVESCRKDSALYPHCPFVETFCTHADDSANLSINLNASIRDIRSRNVILTDDIAALVDAMYQFPDVYKECFSLEIHKAHFEVLLKNASLLMQASRYLWMSVPLDDELVIEALQYCRELQPTKTISQICSSHAVAEDLTKLQKELETISMESDLLSITDITKLKDFQNLTFLEALFVIKNLPLLVGFKLRPNNVKLYALLMQYFTEEDMSLIFKRLVSQNS